ncbi:MAG: dienelactone hydrolase family protein [Acidimicrobiales bacterium]
MMLVETAHPFHVAGVEIYGDLEIPDLAAGLVIFAHGSGSGRHSPRNRMVADHLQDRRLGILLVDLLTQSEERVDRVTAEFRFDIDRLTARVVGLVDWVGAQPDTRQLLIGLFGASTGAAAALHAATDRREHVHAVVSRGGTVQLAQSVLGQVTAPTLLIVGEHDPPILEANRRALALLAGPKRLEIIPGAGHLFEEPGALERVSELAGSWFESCLRRD